jgi:MFS family permease
MSLATNDVSSAPSVERMNAAERRASTSLALVQSLRMLGLFLVLPVLAVHARSLPNGDDARLVGLALGIYGLTQALLQLPLGLASDRFGRKPVIAAGLLVFALGSFVAAGASDLTAIIIGRALQGAGAISAAIGAFVADSTRENQRTKAMALVGISIGAMFALSLIIAPPLYRWVGVSGMFALTGVLALAAIAWVVLGVPSVARAGPMSLSRAGFAQVLAHPDLWRLNLGIGVLHAVQVGVFVVLPGWLVERAGLALGDHWLIYLPVVLLSFAPMMPALGWGERRGRMRIVFLGSVAALVAVQIALLTQPQGLVPFAVLLFVFFAAFNILEASLPSMVSRLAPSALRGAALGLFNTTQSLGLFTGGALAGWLHASWGDRAVFGLALLALGVWLLAAMRHRQWPGRSS